MKEKIIIIVNVVAMLLVGWLFIRYQSSEIDRLATNQQNFIEQVNKTLMLSTDEFKTYLSINNNKLLQRMSDSIRMNIKPRHVVEYNTTNYTYKDTTIIEAPLIQVADYFTFELKDSCFSMSGIADVVNNRIIVDSRELTDQIVRVNYIKREKVKWLFGLRVGKKKAGVYMESKCGTVTNTEINVD
jgi:hypothetical protein